MGGVADILGDALPDIVIAVGVVQDTSKALRARETFLRLLGMQRSQESRRVSRQMLFLSLISRSRDASLNALPTLLAFHQ